MPLQEYRDRREFDQTPEPFGRLIRRSARRNPIFVVQKHHARSPHYDFRLEIDGALASWAVPRGPSLNPMDKRLAIGTEAHPIEYAEFEGLIPAGHYGAGPVMIWDRGRYRLSEDQPAAEELTGGGIKFILHGVKLRGEFVLLRNTWRYKQWLLIKRADEHADTSWDIDSPALDRSIVSGRTLEEIAREEIASRGAKVRTSGGSMLED